MLNRKSKADKQSNVTSKQTNFPEFKIAERQTTISSAVKFSGIGLHSGKKVNMILHPGDENTGIVFKIKNDSYSSSIIKAKYSNVSDTKLCTTLTNEDNISISTTEHLLSALYALNIDNLVVEIDNNELPILDGSSREYVHLLSDVGKIQQNYFRKFIKIKKNINIRHKNSFAKVSPSNDMTISCEINFKTKAIGRQSISFLLTPSIYKSEISNARTFGFLDEISDLRKRGLTIGGSLDNAIVISKDKILNPSGLRFNDEFVRHKALDFIGDISLAGCKIMGSFLTTNGGHFINYALLNKIIDSKNSWDFVDSNQNPIF